METASIVLTVVIVVVSITCPLYCCCVCCFLFNNILVKTFNPKFVFDTGIAKMLDVEGITIFPFIFMKRTLSEYEKDMTRFSHAENFGVLVKHEMVHFHQVQKWGYLTFYLSYGCFALLGLILKCCDKKEVFTKFIPYEIEAYAKQDKDFTKKEISLLSSFLPDYLEKVSRRRNYDTIDE